MQPLTIRFDGIGNTQGANVVHMPKLNEGAPYNFSIRLRYEDETYRDWDNIVDMRWRIKLRPSDKHDLLVLLKSNGNFEIDSGSDTLSFVVKATDWVNVQLPQSPNHLEMDVPFTFVVEFLDDTGAVTERFAQGSGLISVNLGF